MAILLAFILAVMLVFPIGFLAGAAWQSLTMAKKAQEKLSFKERQQFTDLFRKLI